MKSAFFAWVVLLTMLPLPGAEEFWMPSLFNDGMVLQRGKEIKIWGKGPPSSSVGLTLGDETYQTEVAGDGSWEIKIPPQEAGGPHVIQVGVGQVRRTIHDVYFGEVWLASGQSNMAMRLGKSKDGDLEALASANSLIRFFIVPGRTSQHKESDVVAKWLVCGPSTAGAFSGVAYAFASDLQRVLQVPVGIVQTAIGSSKIEAWMDSEWLRADQRFAPAVRVWDDLEAKGWDQSAADQAYQSQMEQWQKNPEGQPKPSPPQNPLTSVRRPGNCFGSMLHPLIGYTIRGFIWYQGESNRQQSSEYAVLFPLLIESWRKAWGDNSLPFLWAQLAAHGEEEVFGGDGWAQLREAQSRTLEIPHTGQAVTIDIGDGADIHPRNKADVGRRLARIALADTYGLKIESRSPEFSRYEIQGDNLRVYFKQVGRGLMTLNYSSVQGFCVVDGAGTARLVKGQIAGPDCVELSIKDVKDPKILAFAFADNPACNLYSSAGLPATPFQAELSFNKSP